MKPLTEGEQWCIVRACEKHAEWLVKRSRFRDELPDYLCSEIEELIADYLFDERLQRLHDEYEEIEEPEFFLKKQAD